MDTLEGLAPNETLGIILAMTAVGTVIAILVLLASVVCRYCVFRREHRNMLKLHTSVYGSGGGGGGGSSRRKRSSRSSQHQQERISRLSDGTGPAGTWLGTTNAELGGAETTETEKKDLMDGGRRPQMEAIEMQDHAHQTQSNGTFKGDSERARKRKEALRNRQFPRGDLLLLEKMGEGEYGPIYRGEAYNLGVRDQSRAVTVKMLAPMEGTAINPNFQLFEQDIEMLMTINHLNVVGMLAVCTEDSPECILLDAGLPGDLLKFIREKKKQQMTAFSAPQDDWMELLKIAEEVAVGMVYLSSEHFVHKDLSLRNCIIGYDGVVKVAHFGLGPVLHPEAYYRVRGNDFPIRWMPPEAINSADFTTMSDIWAFGVLIWELFTYGDLPYAQMNHDETINFVTKEYGRLNHPGACPDEVFSIMTSCWAFDPQMRPTFGILQEQIAELLALEKARS